MHCRFIDSTVPDCHAFITSGSMSIHMHIVFTRHCHSLLACALSLSLAGCEDEKLSGLAAPPGIQAPSSTAEEWVGKAGDWGLRLRLESTELNGTKFQQGEVITTKTDCMPSGKISGNTNANGGVNWIAVSDNIDFVISGAIIGDSIKGTFETRGEVDRCNMRIPVTLTRQPTL